MKVPLEWLKQYIKTDKTARQLAESFTAIGLLLDKPITKFKKDNYQTEVLDLEHRMDRSDWLSILGCARDLCAYEKTKLIFPELNTKKVSKVPPENKIEIKVECPELINRFNTRVFTNVKVQKSPSWLAKRLEAYGIPSINNVVDITNYVMVETGQPMHAQDIDKMKKKEILIRRAKEGEKVITFLGEEMKLDRSMFVLTQDNVPTVIGGIVGGKDTGVDESTKTIVLDAGNYDQNNIRKTSRKLKVQNETVLRYDKFLHPELTELAIQRATRLLIEICDATAFENEDYYPNPEKYKEKEMHLRYLRLEKIGGITLPENTISHILKSLGYEILSTDKEKIVLRVPYFRTDVEVEDDIVSDILRINDYVNIPIKKLEFEPPCEITPKLYTFEEKVRDACVAVGLHEHITEPVVAYDGNQERVVLTNAMSSDKNAMRITVYETLKPVLTFYEKNNLKCAGIFEIGKIYKKENYTETPILEIVAQDSKPNQLLADLFHILNIKEYDLKRHNEITEIVIENKVVGNLKIDSVTIYIETLSQLDMPENTRILTGIVHYTKEAFSILMSAEKSFGELITEIKSLSPQIVEAYVIEQYMDKKLGENMKSLLLEVTYATADTKNIREKIAQVVAKHNAKLR